MNTIRVIDFLLEFLPKPTGDIMSTAQNHLRSLVERYDALAPNWDEAPNWAQWYSIDYHGAFWWEREPVVDGFRYWNRLELLTGEIEYGKWDCDYLGKPPDVPIGIDWRLCKWQRPEGD